MQNIITSFSLITIPASLWVGPWHIQLRRSVLMQPLSRPLPRSRNATSYASLFPWYMVLDTIITGFLPALPHLHPAALRNMEKVEECQWVSGSRKQWKVKSKEGPIVRKRENSNMRCPQSRIGRLINVRDFPINNVDLYKDDLHHTTAFCEKKFSRIYG